MASEAAFGNSTSLELPFPLPPRIWVAGGSLSLKFTNGLLRKQASSSGCFYEEGLASLLFVRPFGFPPETSHGYPAHAAKEGWCRAWEDNLHPASLDRVPSVWAPPPRRYVVELRDCLQIRKTAPVDWYTAFFATFCQALRQCPTLRVVFHQELGKTKLPVTSCAPETYGTSVWPGVSVIQCESVTAVLPEAPGKNG
jgi:hypothetical protein